MSDERKLPPVVIDLGAALKNSFKRTDADRIAALEAELAEARALPRQCAALGHTQNIAGFCAECDPHSTPMQRLDAAQERASAAQAAEARAKKLVADVRAEWNGTKAAHAAEMQAAQAEAAALRRKIEYYVEYPDSRCNSDDDGGCVTIRQLYSAIGVAGRARETK